MGCKKHHGTLPWWPDQQHLHCTACCHNIASQKRWVPVIRAAVAANVSVFHRRQLGLLGANAAAAMDVLSPGGAFGGGVLGLVAGGLARWLLLALLYSSAVGGRFEETRRSDERRRWPSTAQLRWRPGRERGWAKPPLSRWALWL